ncbi:hypothetical protein EDC36_1146 [Tepidimonas ignava]|uniref:Uncharacterized protein n=1 Tax=Tepidimonas ignava TaxID=114249 RepID=A0A4R3L884_9BURK|nr:hypothetical protein EDC36_1146 [Tepidimonas ignava]TSE19980.1 hypothetical protein Tigna_02009 [Tepidimonas ignava]
MGTDADGAIMIHARPGVDNRVVANDGIGLHHGARHHLGSLPQ